MRRGDILLYPNLTSMRGQGGVLKEGVLGTKKGKKLERKAIESLENPKAGRTQNRLIIEEQEKRGMS